MHSPLGSRARSGRADGAITHRPRRPARLTAATVAVCVVLASLGALAGYWLATRGEEEVQTAEAVVLLRPLEGNAFNPEGAGSELVNMETEAQLVQSTLVTGLAAERLGTPAQAEEIRDGVTATVPPNTQLVQITATGEDDAEAVARAEALAETFLAYRGERAESDVFDRSARLREEIRSLEEQRREVVRRLGQTRPDTARALVREQRISELTTQLGEFRVQLAELEAASSDPGQVVTEAEPVAASPLSAPVVLPVAGAVVGLAIALLLVGGRRRLDERVHGVADLQDLGVPVLGRLPGAGAARGPAVAGIRAAVLAAEPTRPLVVGVAIGATHPPEAGPTATADLAGELGVALGRAGLVVAVLDLAAGPGTVAELGGTSVDESEGGLLALSRLLGAERGVADTLARRRASGLPLAVVNDLDADHLADVASSPELRDLLDSLRGVADVVLVDLGCLTEPSAQSLVAAVDSVVLTVREGGSTFGELETALQQTPTWGGRVAGLVAVADGESTPRSGLLGRRSDGDDEPGPDASAGRGGGAQAASVSRFAPEGPR